MLKDFDKITDEEIKDVTLPYNFHAHNHLCGHASGTVEDYARVAKRQGVKYLGISDHMANKLTEPYGYTKIDDIEEKYLSQFRLATEKYGNDVTLLKGGEIEYFESFSSHYENLLKKLQYLILGQHLFNCNGNTYSAFSNCDSEERALALIRQANDGVNSGYFSVLAHPDMVFSSCKEVTPKIKKAFEKLILDASERNVLIEFNANGIRCNGFGYPADILVDICKYYDIPVIVSSDCHMPEVLVDGFVKRLKYYLIKNGLRTVDTEKALKCVNFNR